MGQKAVERVPWKCPECGRGYRLPKGRRPPRVCRQCNGRSDKAIGGVASVDTAAALPELSVPTLDPPANAPMPGPPVLEPPVSVPPVSVPAVPEPLVGQSQLPGMLPAELEAHIARQEREQLLREVSNISRTMTFFRRLCWGMMVLMLLNFVVVGVAFYYSMQQMSSLGGLFENAAAPGQQQNAPGAGAEQLRQMEEYMGTVNELLKDLQRGP